MPTEQTYRMSVRRRIPAPRDVVFEAWIDPQGIREWMLPGDAISANAALDVRVGGSYRIVIRSKDQEHVHTGTYQVVDRPSKLVFTWTSRNDSPATLVTVEFLDRGQETELIITHERFLQAETTKRYEGGWGRIAERFATYLANPSSRAS